MKLSKNQLTTLSTIIYNNNNDIDINERDIHGKTMYTLYNNNLISIGAFNNLYTTEQGLKVYKENITKKKLFINNKNKEIKIEIYKILDNDTYEFIYFFTKDKTGGGKITLKELCKDYIVMD